MSVVFGVVVNTTTGNDVPPLLTLTRYMMSRDESCCNTIVAVHFLPRTSSRKANKT